MVLDISKHINKLSWKLRNKEPVCIAGDMPETQVQSMGQEDSLEEEMATHSCLLVRKIPWTEESGRLQSMRSQRIRHDWATEQT